MKSLLSTIDLPIGGCMLLSVVLSDRTFFAHTSETYEIPFGPKSTAFKVLEDVLEIRKLDFLINFSSVVTFGNAGQANYSSANTLNEELTRRYPNAFSLVTPAILDSTVALDTGYSKTSKLKHLTNWGVTTDKLCEYIEDGLRKLADGPFWLYIPDLNWNTAHSCLGPSHLYNHLVDGREEAEIKELVQPASLRDIVLAHVDVGPEDVSPDVPLTSYGLDSLSAARLSFALRPWMSITQLQLLANLSLVDLELRLQDKPEDILFPQINQARLDFDWKELNKSGDTIVRLRDLEGIPLILIHGASGGIVMFKPLQELFSSPLWAIQSTPETPFQSVFAMAKFYYDQIKKERPDGPYRIAGYCATSLITFEIARLLEASGDRIIQLAFIDHFPVLFCSPLWTWDPDTISHARASDKLVTQQTEVLCCAIRGDSATSNHRQDVANGLMGALCREQALPHVKDYHDMLTILVDMTVDFLLDLSAADLHAVQGALMRWLQGVKTRMTVYVASKGMLMVLPEDVRADWKDLGSHVVGEAKVVSIEGDHFELLESRSFIDSIQFDWEDGGEIKLEM